MFVRNKNIKILLNYCLGPLLFVWLSWSIWQTLKEQKDLHQSLLHMRDAITGEGTGKLAIACTLVLANWGLEARKWQLLIRFLQPMSFFRAFKATLAGLAFAINTPNRIGEYGGRILYIQDGLKWRAVSLTIIGSLSQLIVTLTAGCIGLFILLRPPSAFLDNAIWIKALLSGSAIVTLILILLYFRLGNLVKFIERIPRTNRFLEQLSVIENLPVRILLRVLALSIVRYIVFVVQYILLLQLFDVDVPWATATALVAVLYLVLAIVPTIALAELGVRGKVSLFLFSAFSSNGVGIAGAAAGIWGMNLVVPALAGSLLFVGLKIFSDR